MERPNVARPHIAQDKDKEPADLEQRKPVDLIYGDDLQSNSRDKESGVSDDNLVFSGAGMESGAGPRSAPQDRSLREEGRFLGMEKRLADSKHTNVSAKPREHA